MEFCQGESWGWAAKKNRHLKHPRPTISPRIFLKRSTSSTAKTSMKMSWQCDTNLGRSPCLGAFYYGLTASSLAVAENQQEIR